MQSSSPRWGDLGQPVSPAEAEALAVVKKLLPDDAVTHAWSNLTFTDLNRRTGGDRRPAPDPSWVLRCGAQGLARHHRGDVADLGCRRRVRPAHPARAQPVVPDRAEGEAVVEPAHTSPAQRQRRAAVPLIGALVVPHGRASGVELKVTAIAGLYALDGYSVKGLPADYSLGRFLTTAPSNNAHLIDGPRATQIAHLVKMQVSSQRPRTGS
jgi:hypothetical protein